MTEILAISLTVPLRPLFFKEFHSCCSGGVTPINLSSLLGLICPLHTVIDLIQWVLFFSLFIFIIFIWFFSKASVSFLGFVLLL